MKILICSKLFYPNNSIGAVRPSNFAHYLAKLGHNVVVVTEGVHNSEDMRFQDIEIIRTSNSKAINFLIHRISNQVTKKNFRKWHGDCKTELLQPGNIYRKVYLNNRALFSNSRRQVYNLILELDWLRIARKYVKKKYSKNTFDIVISSFGPFSSYLLGYFVVKSKIGKHWISDLRDNMHNINNPVWLNRIYKNTEKEMIKIADAITLVSFGQAAMYCNSIQNKPYDKSKIHILFNGFEKELKPIQSIKKDKILRISYTGQLYSNLRDLRLLLQVINDLLNESIIDPHKIIFYYAGQNSREFNEQLIQFDKINQVCIDIGFVDRDTSLEIQELSDILVVLTWNTQNDQGIITGKFQEYLQSFRPIISLTSGTLANGELTEMVNKLNLGIACEYVKYEESYTNLKGYICDQYKQIQDGKPLIFNPNIEGIQQFHYEKLTKKLESICLKVIVNS